MTDDQEMTIELLERERDALNQLLYEQSERYRVLLDAAQPFLEAGTQSIMGQPGRHDQCSAIGRFTLGDYRRLLIAAGGTGPSPSAPKGKP